MMYTSLREWNQAADFLSYMYADQQGYITRATIQKEYQQKHYDASHLAKQYYDYEEDVYVSMNTFFRCRRRQEFLKRLNALYIDIDCYNTSFSKEEVLKRLQEEYFETRIPIPTFIIDSGRGLYLIWKINEDRNALPRWKRVMEYLYDQLKEFGADRKAVEPCRILRVPFSINSKSKSQVSIETFYGMEYTLYEIIQGYLPGRNKSESKKDYYYKKHENSKVIYMRSDNDVNALLNARILDLEELFKYRKGENCSREVALFLYRMWWCQITGDYQLALKKTLEWNASFDRPHKESYVISRTASAEKIVKAGKCYKYTNARLICELNITKDEMKRLHVISDESKADKKKEHNHTYYLNKLSKNNKCTKHETRSKRQKKIVDMLCNGYTREEICATLDISRATFYREKKEVEAKIRPQEKKESPVHEKQRNSRIEKNEQKNKKIYSLKKSASILLERSSASDFFFGLRTVGGASFPGIDSS